MPAMMVWPVSWSVRTRKVGSSSASLTSAIPSLSCSAFVLGSMAMSMTGSGNTIDSSSTAEPVAHRVSPVVVLLRPTAATMSPAPTSSTSSRWFACIWSRRPTRSLESLVELSTYEPALIVPE